MTCNSGNVITTEKLVTLNKDINTQHDVITSNNDYTPPASDGEEKLTLKGFENKVDDLILSGEQEITDSINEAIENTIGKSYLGTWTSGVTTFTTMNEYSDHNGITYKPKSGVVLPYVAQGTDPTIAPDNAFVEPFSDINSSNIINYDYKPNLLQNHNFIEPSLGVIVDATPQDFNSGDDVFSSWKALTAIVGGKYENGEWSRVSGSIYQDIPKLGALEFISSFKASIKSTTGPITETGVSFSLVGDSYRIVVDASNVFSVCFNEGDFAASHNADYGVTAEGSTTPRPDYVRAGDTVNVADFGILPHNSRLVNDARLAMLLDTVASGSTVNFNHGFYRFTELEHPQKPLHFKGTGKSVQGNYPTALQNSGTILQFSGPLGIWWKGARPEGNSRFSSLSDMTIFGDGTTDDDGTNKLLKINNQGVDLINIDTRFSNEGIECNSSTGMMWDNVECTAKTKAIWFGYDPLDPYSDTVHTSWCTASSFKDVFGHTSTSEVGATGWTVDSTCQYGGNTHINTDLESCYVGMRLEGRVSSKDYITPLGVTVQAFGCSGWKGTGNTFIGTWFERNTGDNLEIVQDDDLDSEGNYLYDIRVMFSQLYQDSHKVTGRSNLLYKSGSGDIPLTPGAEERAYGTIGSWGSPLTANQYLLNGPEVNSNKSRTKVEELVSHQSANRATSRSIPVRRFAFSNTSLDSLTDIKIAELDLEQPWKSSVVNVTLSGMSSGLQSESFIASYQVNSTDTAMNSEVIVENSRVSPSYLELTFTQITPTKMAINIHTRLVAVQWRLSGSVEIVVGGDRYGDFSSTLTIEN